MMSFKEFMGSQEIPQAQSQPQDLVAAIAQPGAEATQSTKWKATKDEIMAYWKNLRPDIPVQMQAIDYTHKGSTYGEDGMRLTGSPQFISSVLARMKELLAYETPTTKLAVTYRQTESPSKLAMGQSKTSYVFYVATRQRGDGDKNSK